jgi:hypothetical protein
MLRRLFHRFRQNDVMQSETSHGSQTVARTMTLFAALDPARI